MIPVLGFLMYCFKMCNHFLKSKLIKICFNFFPPIIELISLIFLESSPTVNSRSLAALGEDLGSPD